jgi:ribosomal protein L40E
MLEVEVKVCRNCARQNEPTANKCVYCGEVLGSTTVRLPAQPMSEINQKRIMVKPEGGVITLFIPGYEKPLSVELAKEMRIGRSSQNTESPEIDLSDYNAAALGISRRHARLTMQDDGLTIEDLDSSNGTWLNERPLSSGTQYVIHNGDCIRLAQMFIYMFFDEQGITEESQPDAATTEEPTISPGEETTAHKKPAKPSFTTAFDELQQLFQPLEENLLILNAPDSTIQIASVQFLSDIVLPFLRHISEIQRHIDSMLDRESQDNIVKDIQYNKSVSHYIVRVLGVADAIQILSKIPETPEAPLFNMQLRTALAEIAPAVPLDVRERQLSKMIPSIKAILASPLKMSNG